MLFPPLTEAPSSTTVQLQENTSFKILTMLHPEQKRIYQSMTPQEKVNLARDLDHFARELKAAGLRARHPDWPEKRIQDKVKEIFLYAST
jgi:hypothetical protein